MVKVIKFCSSNRWKMSVDTNNLRELVTWNLRLHLDCKLQLRTKGSHTFLWTHRNRILKGLKLISKTQTRRIMDQSKIINVAHLEIRTNRRDK